MKSPLYEQEQARKAKTRFRMLQQAQEISHNASQTCRFFGISRAQYYIWLPRFEKNEKEGLRDRSRGPSMICYRIPPEVMDEMLALKPEPRLEDIEEADDWLNRNNTARTIPQCYEAVGEFLSDVRYEYC